MIWLKLEVYNKEHYLGSFYIEDTIKSNIIAQIDAKYGKGNWTKYNIGN